MKQLGFLEAGPTHELWPDSKLKEQPYNDNLDRDSRLYLPLRPDQANSMAETFLAENRIYGLIPTANLPPYTVATNSNTWVDALGLRAGYNQEEIDLFLAALQTLSGLSPVGADNGAWIASDF